MNMSGVNNRTLTFIALVCLILSAGAVMDISEIPILVGTSNYGEWFAAMVQYSMSICRVGPYINVGLAHIMGISLVTWQSLIGNNLLIIPDDPVEPPVLAGTHSRVEILNYTRDTDIFIEFKKGFAKICEVVHATCSTTIRGRFTSPVTRLINVPLPQVLATLFSAFGKPTASDMKLWNANLRRPFTGTDVNSITAFFSEFERTCALLDNIHNAPGEASAIQLIYENAKGHHQIQHAIEQYLTAPGSDDMATQSVAGLKAFVLRRMVNISSLVCADLFSGTGGPVHTAHAAQATDAQSAQIATLQDEIAGLKSTVQMLVMSTAQGSGAALAATLAAMPKPAEDILKRSANYCFLHGYTDAGKSWTHGGIDCFVMNGHSRRAEFTEQQRRAKSHNEVSGGKSGKFVPAAVLAKQQRRRGGP